MGQRISIAVLAAIAGSIPQVASSSAAAPTVAFRSDYGPAGGSEAVHVSGVALVHTAQVMPTDASRGIVGGGEADAQIALVWQNMRPALMTAESTVDRVVRLNAAVRNDGGVDLLERYVVRIFPPNQRPCVSLVRGGLPNPEALFALDAVATGPSLERSAGTARWMSSASLAGDPGTSHAAILPNGSRVYISGRPTDGNVGSATRAMRRKLDETPRFFGLESLHIVQLKCFVRPVSEAPAAQRSILEFYGGRAPPVVFVEWLNSQAFEIEAIAAAPRRSARDRNPDSARYDRVTRLRPHRTRVSSRFDLRLDVEWTHRIPRRPADPRDVRRSFPNSWPSRQRFAALGEGDILRE